MTTLCTVELTCPVCDKVFASQAVVTTDSLGGKRTDFHQRATGMQPLPYLIHTCCRCGYTGSDRDFSVDAEVTPSLRALVWNELAPIVDTAIGTGSEKYEAAARIALWQGLGPDDIGHLWLRAAWCCVDEGDVEAERYFRRKAVVAFEQALNCWDAVAEEQRAVLTYLVGELWRRIGYEKLARRWFEKVAGEVVDRTKQQWVLDAARQQRMAPRVWFM